MKQPDNYLTQLKILVGAYGTGVIAQLLDTTERGMKYWTAEDPKTPRAETIRKISELYNKHSSGEDLREAYPGNLQAEFRAFYKDQIEFHKEQNKLLQAQVNSLTGQLRHLILITHAKVETNQHALADLLVKQKIEPAELVEDRLSKENLRNYEKLKLEMGIV